MTNKSYAAAGVDVDLGNDVSKMLYEAAKATWRNRQGKLGEIIVPFDDFSGIRFVNVANLPLGTVMNIGLDGIGTKVELAERVNDHSTMAFDLLAMVCDDAVVRGAEPVLVGSILDVKSLGKNGKQSSEQVRQLARGYRMAAEAADVAIINGEVAELGSRVGGFGDFNYNWGAVVVWFAKKERLFTGKEVMERDFLIGLREEGFRSNGLSLVRKVLGAEHGADWHLATYNGESLGRQVVMPSRIYCKAIVDMFGGFAGEQKVELHGVAHITGGGLPEKLGRILKPAGLGAVVDDPFVPSPLMLYCQEKGNISDSDAYGTWNMGQGMIIISPNPEKVIDLAKLHGIEAKVIGSVVTEKGISIYSRGFFEKNTPLQFK